MKKSISKALLLFTLLCVVSNVSFANSKCLTSPSFAFLSKDTPISKLPSHPWVDKWLQMSRQERHFEQEANIKTIEFNGEKLDIVQPLGDGGDGFVYLATDGKSYFALKQLHAHFSQENFLSFLENINTAFHSNNQHLNLPKFYAVDIPNKTIKFEYIFGLPVDVMKRSHQEIGIPEEIMDEVLLDSLLQGPFDFNQIYNPIEEKVYTIDLQ